MYQKRSRNLYAAENAFLGQRSSEKKIIETQWYMEVAGKIIVLHVQQDLRI